jgi:hypothetical protein
MPLDTLLTGHGPTVTGHAALIAARLAEHDERSERIAAALEEGPDTAYGIAQRLWPARLVREQPLLVVWEVLGHLDVMVSAGRLTERPTAQGRSLFARSAVAA